MTSGPAKLHQHADAQQGGLEAAYKWIKSGPKGLLIGGKSLPARSGKYLETINPTTEEVLTRIADGDKADVDAAVVSARRAFDDGHWRGMSPHARTRHLLRIADKIEKHADELAAIDCLDNGMPFWFASAGLSFVVDAFRYYAGWPSKLLGTTNPTDSSTFIYTLKEPVGVCGLIIPWNTPMLAQALKIAPALACGNTIVLKPSELASLSSLRVAELIRETDLPDGVLNVVTGYGPTAGAAVAEHMDIDKVSFTGSTATGKQILHASTGNLKRITLELGGKTPNIIFPDADLERAIPSSVLGFTRNSGQVCSAGSRIFVHESIHDEIAERIAAVAAAQTVGAPFDADTKMGPLISAKQLDRVMSYVNIGNRDGATLRTGGQRLDGKGYFYTPTVFADVTNEMTIAREEIFGPVVAVIPFKDEHDAVFKGNDTTYGLSAGIWTRDIDRAHIVARGLKAGRIWINTFGESDPVMPFGGYKQSGLGREFGAESLAAYTETKSVQIRFS